jgi:hypothetical protein
VLAQLCADEICEAIDLLQVVCATSSSVEPNIDTLFAGVPQLLQPREYPHRRA